LQSSVTFDVFLKAEKKTEIIFKPIQKVADFLATIDTLNKDVNE